MKPNKISQKELLVKKAREYSLKKKTEMDLFYKNHCLNNSDTLSIVLKTHLYIEGCLDELLKMNLPNPKYVLDKTFVQKLDVFEALNLGFPPGNGFIESKLKLINKVRNSFAHNLDKNLTEEEFKQLAAGVKKPNIKNDLTSLKYVFMHIIGYLHALVAMNDFYSFLNSYQRNKAIFTRDIFWKDEIVRAYNLEEAIESMEFLKL